MKIMVIIAGVVSVVQVFDSSFLNAWMHIGKDMDASIYTFRRSSIYGFVEPNALGLSFMPLASVLIGYLLIKKNRLFAYYSLLIGLIAILSNGRYIMVGFVLLSLQYLIYYKVKAKIIIRYASYIIILGVILYYLLINMGYDLLDWYQKRLFAEGDITESTRFGAINTFAEFFPQKPIFGTGVHQTDEIKEASAEIHSSQIHVGYLSHLVSYGLVGSFLLFGFWFLLAKRLFRTAKYTNYWGSFFAFLIYLWAQFTLVNYSIYFIGIVFALIFDKYHYDNFKRDMFNNHFNL